MKKFLKAMFAIDKEAHFGWGAMICAAIVLVCLLQDLPVQLSWSLLWVCLIGTIVAVIFELLKEFVVDAKCDWLDIAATVGGCVIVWLATAAGIWFNIIAHARNW